MSVRPVAFQPNGDIDVVYDELGHEGRVLAAEVRWGISLGGGEDHNYIVLVCPDGCGAASTWPVGGGADAARGQEMFVRKVNLEGCACPTVGEPDPPTAAVAHVKELVTAMDGADRWQLNDTAMVETLSAA
jgi:hypothetical protein